MHISGLCNRSPAAFRKAGYFTKLPNADRVIDSCFFYFMQKNFQKKSPLGSPAKGVLFYICINQSISLTDLQMLCHGGLRLLPFHVLCHGSRQGQVLSRV